MENKPVVLSGMRPSGKLHIGHLEGVLREWVELQRNHECNFFVADYHAITTNPDTTSLKEDTIDMVRDWIAFGIDPEESTLFVQSYVPAHPELHLIYSMLVNLGRLERLPTFIDYMKEIIKVDDKDIKKFDEAKRANVNYGFLGYPVLQAADILAYKADIVPVGEDQIPHIELSREIAKRFNNIYGEVFPLPEAKLGHAPKILGTDGRKMSKSYNNVISPMDELEVLKENVKKMVSDPKRPSIDDAGHPYECGVFDLHEVYDKEGSSEIAKKCLAAGLGCGECKSTLPKKIFDAYSEFREKARALSDDYVIDVLREGTKRAREKTSKTMQEVKEAMLMDYLE